MAMKEVYKALMKQMEEYHLLTMMQMQLSWDMQTYMPPKGSGLKRRQLRLLSAKSHELIADPKIKTLVDSLTSHKGFATLSPVQKRNIHLTEKLHLLKTKIPTALVEERAEQSVKSWAVWEKAKKTANYSLFKPELEKNLQLVRKLATALDPTAPPYNVLLDAYIEPGMTAEKLAPMFERIKQILIPLIDRCLSAPRQPNLSILEQKCPLSVQRALAEHVTRTVGYDFDAGRIDEAEHPFTTPTQCGDVRITTHYYDNFMRGFFAVLHEAGHAMHLQAIPEEYAVQPVGECLSGGINESQSRLIENFIGRSWEFWSYYLPQFKRITGDLFQDVDLDMLYFAVNQVARTPIRMYADELTYALHIILRFELNQELLGDRIDLDDLPGVWNEKMSDYLGIEVENDTEGFLQDGHWAGSGFFAFAHYELGNIYAAQLMATIKREIPNYKDQITEGNFLPLNTWLNKNIRQHGSLYDAEELIEKATGEKPTEKYLIEHLTEKFTALYEI